MKTHQLERLVRETSGFILTKAVGVGCGLQSNVYSNKNNKLTSFLPCSALIPASMAK
jgi:hypothetical protein